MDESPLKEESPGDSSPVRRGPKLMGKVKRKRFNLSLDPEVVEAGQRQAETEEASFSLWVEGLIKDALGLKPPSKKD